MNTSSSHKNVPALPLLQYRMLNASSISTLEQIALRNLGFQMQSHEKNTPSLQVPLHTIQAEAIRAALWMHSCEGTQKVHINRFLRTAQRLMRPIWQNRGTIKDINLRISDGNIMLIEDEQEIKLDSSLYQLHRDALNELELIGDIAELSNGYWLPGPLRMVFLPAIQQWMLVGGMPTYRFPQIAQQTIEYNNFTRLFSCNPEEVGLRCSTQQIEAWYRMPEEPLDEWTQRLFRETKLEPHQREEGSYEIYAPANNPSFIQFYRWVKIYKTHDGRYLARYDSKVGRKYRIIEVKQGKIIALGEIAWGQNDCRRLCYGIDALADRSMSIEVERGLSNNIFHLRSELPRPEYRLFTALGRLHLNKNGKYYPRHWEICCAHSREAEKALIKLGVKIIFKK